MVATPVISLPHEIHGQTGLRLVLAVYRHNAPTTTIAERRQALRGFVVAVLQLKSLMEESFAGTMLSGVDLQLLDSSDPNHETLLYASHSPGKSPDGLSPVTIPSRQPKSRTTLNVAGRRWTVACTATPKFVAMRSTWHPWAARRPVCC